MKIAVGIPTIGRAPILVETLRELALQTRQPDAIIVCGTRSSDLAGVANASPDTVTLISEAGLPRQRNMIIDAATSFDVIVFFDDDFLASPDYMSAVEQCMMSDPGIVVVTGKVIADGINGPGLTPEAGRQILKVAVAKPSTSHGPVPTFSGYGCNMAVRLSPMRQHALRFDERLPFYGWQEDVDLSRRLAQYGRVVLLDDAQGIHLGAKSGRGSGVRLGYSQVANPIYLAGKRQGYPLRRAITHILKNMAMNTAKASWPEPHVDRRGRLVGNLLAFRDLILGRMKPEKVLEL